MASVQLRAGRNKLLSITLTGNITWLTKAAEEDIYEILYQELNFKTADRRSLANMLKHDLFLYLFTIWE